MSTDSFKILSVCVVLIILMIGLYWYKKELNTRFKNSNMALLRQVGSLSVGTRERLIVIEISDRWVVIGLTSGRMVALAELEKPTPPSETNAEDSSTPTFPFQAIVNNLELTK